MTALGGKLPEFKGEDELTLAVVDFHETYDKYKALFNTHVQYMADEKELLLERDVDGLVTVRRASAIALADVNNLRDEVRKKWKHMKTVYRRFNRGKML